MKNYPNTLAERVNWLFENIRRDNGKEYSYKQVEAAMRELGHSATNTYIWKMRNGQAKKPNWLILRGFAKFFNVPITFFYDEKLTEEKLNHILEEAGYDTSMPTSALRRIRKDPEVEEMAKQVSQLDKEDQRTILDVIRVIMRKNKK